MSRDYQFQSRPQAVSANNGRKKYRDMPPKGSMAAYRRNLMHDRRVVRGNTHAAVIDQPSASFRSTQAVRGNSRRRPARRLDGKSYSREQDYTTDSMMDYESQENMLEELPMPREAQQKTEELPVHEEIEFIPKPSGVNQATEIAKGDLFDFELAVEPVLELLVGKTLNQTLAEVLGIREKLYNQKQQEEFDLNRQVKLAETKRLEAECLRRTEEIERRSEQNQEMAVREKVTAHKLASRTSASTFINQLQSTVLAELKDIGHYHDPVVKQVETVFLPWLLVEVNTRLSAVTASRKLVDKMLTSSVHGIVREATDAARQRAVEMAVIQEEENRLNERRRKRDQIAQERADAEAKRLALQAAKNQDDEDS